jgi:hypothetical protein
MDEFLLNLLRGVVVRSLKWSLLHPKTKGVAECAGVEQVEGLDDVACFLYIQSLKSQTLRNLQAEVEAAAARCNGYVEQFKKIRQVTKKKSGTAGIANHSLPGQSSLSSFPPRPNPKVTDPPLQYPTLPYRDKRIPVYSLKDLLGEGRTTDLLKETVFEDSRYLVVKEGRLTANAQMALMKLQGYLT